MNHVQQRRANAERLCAMHGLTVAPFGAGFHIHGQGVDVLIARLEYFGENDLLPEYAPRAKVALIASNKGGSNGD